jgi:GTPase SAR1 family protein
MTKAVIQPLESYRLVQYAVPMPCYICESDNTTDAEYCHVCAAPMALAHQAKMQKMCPQMIAVMGPSGVGKTVYLGMLMDLLSQQTSLQALARGAFSITLQQRTLAALSRCEFPRKTPNEPDSWNWVHCQIRLSGQRTPLELILPDMAGEALLTEIDHPHSYRIIGEFLRKCMGAMILVDAIQIKEGNREQEFFTEKLLTHFSELEAEDGPPARERPLAVILTKVDHCEECADNPEEFARLHAGGLWQNCLARFPHHRFFAVGVAGSCAACDTLTEGRLQFPLRIEPHGVVDPFLWILDQLNVGEGGKQKKKK